MTSLDEQPRYLPFLPTMWEERSQHPDWAPVWRFRLEDPRTGTRRGFATLEAPVSGLERILTDAEKEWLDRRQSLA